METILTAFIVITLILFAALTIFTGYLTAQDTLRAAWQEMEDRLAAQRRTDLTPLLAETQSSGAVIELTLRNEGDTRLTDFDAWDVMTQYYTAPGDYQILWFRYVEDEPASGEWCVIGIYLDAATATPEMYEPGILNPGEEMLLRLRVVPPVGPNTTNLAVISTDTGVTMSMMFTR